MKLGADNVLIKKLLDPVPEVPVAPKDDLTGLGLVAEGLVIVPQMTRCWLTEDDVCR